MPTTALIAQTDEGRLLLHGNELELYATGDDPVAIRLRSPNGGIGKLSWDAPDGAGGWTEIGYIFGKRDERGRTDSAHAGKVEFEFWQSGSRDGDGKRLFTVRHDGVVLGSPVQVDRMADPSGRFVTVQQGDGNFVTYDRTKGEVGDERASVWRSGVDVEP